MITRDKPELSRALTTVLEKHGAGGEINLPPLRKPERGCDDAAATTADRGKLKDAVKLLLKLVKACTMTFHVITMRMGTDKG